MTWLINFSFGWMMPFLLFLKPSVCGHDGKASSRKLSSGAFMLLIASYTSKLIMRESVQIEHVWVLCVLTATLLLLNGILTIQNVLTFLKINKGQSPEQKQPNGGETAGS